MRRLLNTPAARECDSRFRFSAPEVGAVAKQLAMVWCPICCLQVGLPQRCTFTISFAVCASAAPGHASGQQGVWSPNHKSKGTLSLSRCDEYTCLIESLTTSPRFLWTHQGGQCASPLRWHQRQPAWSRGEKRDRRLPPRGLKLPRSCEGQAMERFLAVCGLRKAFSFRLVPCGQGRG